MRLFKKKENEQKHIIKEKSKQEIIDEFFNIEPQKLSPLDEFLTRNMFLNKKFIEKIEPYLSDRKIIVLNSMDDINHEKYILKSTISIVGNHHLTESLFRFEDSIKIELDYNLGKKIIDKVIVFYPFCKQEIIYGWFQNCYEEGGISWRITQCPEHHFSFECRFKIFDKGME